MTARADRVKHVTGILVLAGVYVGAAKLGLALEVAHGNVTPVWAPTGISLAALLIFGRRLWPGVAVGALIANATTPIPVLAAAGIALGNTLEALVGVELLKRARFDKRMHRFSDVISLLVLAAMASTAVSATIGTASLLVAGEITTGSYGYSWLLWWFGDAMGDLLVAPLLLAWLSRHRHPRRRPLEVAALTVGLGIASAVTFFGHDWTYPFVIFPFLLWATIRFHQRGATASIFAVSAFGIAGLLTGSLPIETATPTQAVAILQTLLSISAVSMLILAATITEREESEVLARKREAQLEEAQQIAHVGSWEWDIRANVVTWSRELYRIYGIEESTLEGTYEGYLRRLHPDDRERVDRIVREAFETRSAFTFDHRIVRPDGTERILHARGDVIQEDDVPIAMVGTAQDITERKRLEEIRDHFIVNAAHELRTPITSMVGFASVLHENRDQLSEERLEHVLDRMRWHGDRLRRLVDGLLDLSMLQQGRRLNSPDRISVKQAVKDAIAAVAPSGEKTIRLDVPEDVQILGEHDALDQVLTNLLANALRYGGPNITVTARDAGETAEIVVADDGDGVPEVIAPNLFDAFVRGQNAAGTGGAGLGLAIVRVLLEALDGAITYEPASPRGARFVITLPAAVPARV